MKDNFPPNTTPMEEEEENIEIKIYWRSGNVSPTVSEKAEKSWFNPFDAPRKGSRMDRWDRGE